MVFLYIIETSLECIGVLTVILLLYLCYKVVRFMLSDCDLKLMSCTIKPEYYQNKVVWLVGASGGIGQEIARGLAVLRCRVILSDLPSEKAAMMELKQYFSRPQQDVKIIPLDLTESETLRSKVEQATKAFGHIDMLILAAGVTNMGHFKDIHPGLDRRVMEVNYFGQRALIQGVLPGMTQRKSGHIVGVTSAAGRVGLPIVSSYSASKFALCGLLEAIRPELLNHGIKVTTVCPSDVNTSGRREAEAARRNENEDTPSDSVAEPLSCRRCAAQVLIAACNQLNEVWVGGFPQLQSLYLAYYNQNAKSHVGLNQYRAQLKLLKGKLK